MDLKNMSIWKGENTEKKDDIKIYIRKNYVSIKEIDKIINKYKYYLEKAKQNKERLMKSCYNEIIEDLTEIKMNRM